ncbi:UNVERIFIED_CONTAM: Ubiquitin domain-containing protein 7SL RNA1 [Sesamum radiatum]|uniref:Ubiquitin domain-containing protein 7SL RNA1 n=1 Tax=Sesamum radiatum TaxID=300843 RepID=A0AAW2VIE6_SESRA
MDVIFHPSGGSPFCIEVGYFDTVLEMKEKIQKYQGIPISEQILIFNGDILEDELNVHNSDILDRSRIDLLLASDAATLADELISPSKIRLLLKMPSKLRVALDVDVNETIRRLKEKIHEMERVPINQLAVHANGIELHDDKSMQDCELSDNSEIDIVAVRSSPEQSDNSEIDIVAVRSSPELSDNSEIDIVAVRSPPVTTTTSRSSSGGNMNVGPRRLRIIVANQSGTEKIPVEVNPSDNVGKLRKKLRELKMDVPREGYFFIYKQDVMDDDQSFRWHHVCHGDTIEVFRGHVSSGS